MRCAKCGTSAVAQIDSEGSTKYGSFTERYECAECGAEGRIDGEAQDHPRDWEKTGSVFQG